MRTFIFFLIVIPLIGTSISCSDVQKNNTIRGTIEGIGNARIMLFAYDGKDLRLIDSVMSRQDAFIFELPETLKNGMLHIRWGSLPTEGLDLVYNYSDIIFTTKKDSIHLIEFENSPDNEFFFAFYPIKLTIKKLTNLGDQLNKTDPIGNKPKLIQLNHYIDSVEFHVNNLLASMNEETKSLFAYKIIRTAFYPNYDWELAQGNIQKQDPYQYLQSSFFKYVDFREPGLIRTPFIHELIEEYLMFYVDPPTEEEYKKACNMIIAKAAVNDEMYDYVVNLLIRTFEQSDFLDLYLYLMETYAPEICNETTGQSDRHHTYEIIKNSRPGSKAKDIWGFTPEGKTINLFSTVNTNGIVLFFWDPDCEHCKMLIRQLVTIWPAYKDKGLEVFTFGLTKSREEWINAIKEYHMEPFTNVSDFKDTESIVFDKYHIRGTPEIYLLTKDFVIFSRPSNSLQLDKDLMNLLN